MSIDNTADVIDSRDVIARVEEIEDELASYDDPTADEYDDLRDELKLLRDFLEELAGNGGDEQWRGTWYPVTLIRYSYFVDYAQELADDLGLISVRCVMAGHMHRLGESGAGTAHGFTHPSTSPALPTGFGENNAVRYRHLRVVLPDVPALPGRQAVPSTVHDGR